MYGRKLGDRVLTFGHQGMLYRNSFVMYDKQTESLWVHVTGEAVKGPLKGSHLAFLPSEVVAWGDWRRDHPDTTVLLGEKARGFMGTFALKDRMDAYGLSLGEGRNVVFFPYSYLAKKPLLNTRLANQPVVVVFDATTARSAAFSSVDGDRNLSFEMVSSQSGSEGDATKTSKSGGKRPAAVSLWMRDTQTGSLWDRLRGVCIKGALKGKHLKQLPATPWLEKRWEVFFPQGKRIGKAGKKGSPAPAGTPSGK